MKSKSAIFAFTVLAFSSAVAKDQPEWYTSGNCYFVPAYSAQFHDGRLQVRIRQLPCYEDPDNLVARPKFIFNGFKAKDAHSASEVVTKVSVAMEISKASCSPNPLVERHWYITITPAEYKEKFEGVELVPLEQNERKGTTLCQRLNSATGMPETLAK